MKRKITSEYNTILHEFHAKPQYNLVGQSSPPFLHAAKSFCGQLQDQILSKLLNNINENDAFVDYLNFVNTYL
jgi:hypothetical protein